MSFLNGAPQVLPRLKTRIQWNRPLGLFGIFGSDFCEQDIFYRDTEDNDEKTVERSPELSVGNGGELDLLKMDFREI